MRKHSSMWKSETAAFYFFISPWIIGFLAFTALPIFSSFYLSFTRYNISRPPVGIGLGNYAELLGDTLFSTSLYNTVYYAVFFVPLGIVLAFGLALLLNQKVAGLAVYRTVFYLPSIVPVVANAILWLWLLNPQWGLINMGLRFFGIDGPRWLGSMEWAKPAIILMSLWTVGPMVIIYLAGLQGVPQQLYEAAEVDGASKLRSFFSITLPMMTPTIFFTLITGLIGAFQIFTQAYVMTGGGPVNSTLFYVLYIFRNAFNYLRMGYASSMAWILFIIILVLTLVQFRISKRWVFYG